MSGPSQEMINRRNKLQKLRNDYEEALSAFNRADEEFWARGADEVGEDEEARRKEIARKNPELYKDMVNKKARERELYIAHALAEQK